MIVTLTERYVFFQNAFLSFRFARRQFSFDEIKLARNIQQPFLFKHTITIIYTLIMLKLYFRYR